MGAYWSGYPDRIRACSKISIFEDFWISDTQNYHLGRFEISISPDDSSKCSLLVQTFWKSVVFVFLINFRDLPALRFHRIANNENAYLQCWLDAKHQFFLKTVNIFDKIPFADEQKCFFFKKPCLAICEAKHFQKTLVLRFLLCSINIFPQERICWFRNTQQISYVFDGNKEAVWTGFFNIEC